MKLAYIDIDTPSTVFTTGQYPYVFARFTTRVLMYAIPAAGIYFFLRLVLSGYSYMTSLGNQEKIQAAHQQMINSLFGLLIVISAYFIAQLVQYLFNLNFL